MKVVFSTIVRALAITAGLTTTTGATLADAPSAELCPSQAAVIYFQPGEAMLDDHDQAVVRGIVDRAYACLIDRLEVDSFADQADGLDQADRLSADRAANVLGALGERGVAALDVKVRLYHESSYKPSAELRDSLGRRAIVRIRMRQNLSPMS